MNEDRLVLTIDSFAPSPLSCEWIYRTNAICPSACALLAPRAQESFRIPDIQASNSLSRKSYSSSGLQASSPIGLPSISVVPEASTT